MLAESCKINLKGSILFSIEFLKSHLTREYSDIIGESLIQLVKDIFYFKTDKHLMDNVNNSFELMKLELSPDEKEEIQKLERSLKKVEDYQEFSNHINLNLIKSILNKLEVN